MSNYKNLLISEPPLQVLPTLAETIGLNEAIVIQQLHYWVGNAKNDGFIDKDGVKWVFNTYEQWRENFPFWSLHTIQRIFLNLEKMGIIVSAQLSRDSHDKTKYYRIDYARLEASNMPNWHYGTPHIGVMDDAKMALSLNESETTTKTTQRLEKNFSKKVNIRGIESAIITGRDVTEDDFIPENKPMIAVIETLASGFGYNFPHFGESRAFDRSIRLITADGRDVQTFIIWAKTNKRDPRWYHIKPDTLWGDWPQAFYESQSLSPVELAYQQIEKERTNGCNI